jgi:hypothetical protein
MTDKSTFGKAFCPHAVAYDCAACLAQPEDTPEATAPGLTEAWAEAEGVVYWDWAIRLTRLVKGGYRAEAIAGDEVKVYTVASDPDAALRELSDVITESHVND